MYLFDETYIRYGMFIIHLIILSKYKHLRYYINNNKIVIIYYNSKVDLYLSCDLIIDRSIVHVIGNTNMTLSS